MVRRRKPGSRSGSRLPIERINLWTADVARYQQRIPRPPDRFTRHAIPRAGECLSNWPDAGQVVFHCCADRCFLSEYWTPTRENGSQLLPSRYEAELAKHGKGIEFALLDPMGKR